MTTWPPENNFATSPSDELSWWYWFVELFKGSSAREVTAVVSTVCVVVLAMLAACVWCVIRHLRSTQHRNQAKDELADLGIDESSPSTPSDSSPQETKESDNKSFTVSGTIPPFSTMSSQKGKKLMFHKNIITPDRSITFVVPTIPLPAQPGESKERQLPGGSSSRSSQQYYPQLANSEDKSPKIGFCLFYEVASQILYVRLLAGHNFPEYVHHYVTVKIYPGRGGKQRSKEFQGDCPIFNQEFSFHARKEVLHTKILKMRVMALAAAKSVLGCVNLALKDVRGFDSEATQDLRTGQLWKRLEQPCDISEGVKLQVSLKWTAEPHPGLLTLKIIEASGLHVHGDNDFTSSYVKVTLQEQGRNVKARKTRLIRWGSVPVFDDVFVVTIQQELLSQISFMLVVIARGRLGSKVVLGKISIGSLPYANPSTGSSTSGTDFWEDMCHQPNTEIVRWLHLIP